MYIVVFWIEMSWKGNNLLKMRMKFCKLRGETSVHATPFTVLLLKRY
jgi:hypothetical protein